jgi:two-component system KDP operon response regulator KdpE
MMNHPGQTLESTTLIDRIWGYSGGGDANMLKNVVYRLRRKVEVEPGQPRYIQSKPGEGYMFQP